ncbi:Inositol polyphosphate multikinase beta [Abeliophyllum distichum]|uniref:Inositol polyphosphate multikinase n=1 Tax=Abeliophyllum distichum TaxID=126358 RepID=A0ABD1V9F0_9LAMI
MLKVPVHQVAGHKAGTGKLGPLIDDSRHFYKPLQSDERGSNEVSFYASFSSNTRIPGHIRRFFPNFYGTQLVEASDGSGLQPHLVLQDLTSGKVNPSIMDIKIGSRTWAPQATEDNIRKCLKKDRESSSLPLGFRFSGLQIYESRESGFWKPEKRSIRCLSADEVKLILRKFVSSHTSSELDSKPDCAFASVVYGGSTGILAQLLELKAWFEDQTVYHFCSSSVLIMYEKELVSNGKNSRAEIKLVDFAHAVGGNGVIDHNFLGGLCSLIKLISEILTTPDECTTEASSEDIQKNRISENGRKGVDYTRLSYPHRNFLLKANPGEKWSTWYLAQGQPTFQIRDVDNLQDICPTNTKDQRIFINGFLCKNPANITASDFKSSLLNQGGDTGNFYRSSMNIITAAEFPGLNTLGLSASRTDLEDDGLVTPHAHPRASEMMFVSTGVVVAGFVDSNNQVFQKVLNAGDVFVFPRGLLHFCFNAGFEHATVFSVLNSQNPGLVSISGALFAPNDSKAMKMLMKKLISLSTLDLGRSDMNLFWN